MSVSRVVELRCSRGKIVAPIEDGIDPSEILDRLMDHLPWVDPYGYRGGVRDAKPWERRGRQDHQEA